MASSIMSILKGVLKLNCMHVISCEKEIVTVSRDKKQFEQMRIIVNARPYRRKQNICPKCGRRCSGYDTKYPEHETTWRAPNINGVPVLIRYTPNRIKCPEHSVITENIPWADGSSHFTEAFNNEVAWLSLQMSRKALTEYVGINWRTVGNCVKAAKDRIEPDVSVRLRDLKRICVDETGSRKGYKYITVVYDMDRNRVVWVGEGVGLKVFTKFCMLLSTEERSRIEVVAGDGARWIDTCVKDFFPNAVRCIDFFHVVEWANDALDKVRMSIASKARREYDNLKDKLIREEAEEKARQSKLRESYIMTVSELSTMSQQGIADKHKRELVEYISELEGLIKPLDLSAGWMSVELLPEHQNLLRKYEQLRKTTDGSNSDETSKKANHAIVDALAKARSQLASIKYRGAPSARMQKIINFISIFGEVDRNWNASGKPGRPRKERLTAEHQKMLDEYKARVSEVKDSKHALGHRPENCTESQRDKLKMIENSYPDLYRAYQLKESLRIILHMKNNDLAAAELEQWISDTSRSGLKSMAELANKIKRHRTNILNSVKHQANSSKSESANTTIKAAIRTARGFRNMDNLIAFIYLKCSDLVIPLDNRYQASAEKAAEKRARDNELRRKREEARREAFEQSHPA